VSLVHFESAGRFEREDLLTMTRALEQLVVRCGEVWPRRASDLVLQARRGLLEALGLPSAAGAPCGMTTGRTPERAAAGAAFDPDVLVEVAAERLLDVAAHLLDASGLVQDHGGIVDAFALEGIQGRLLEAVVGAGRLEAIEGRPAGAADVRP
jgi:hypothetical protein